MLIDVKMPTIVGILTFMNRINFRAQLSSAWKKFYNLEAWLNQKHFLTLCLLGNFSCFLLFVDFFQNKPFLKKSFRNIIRVSNSLDPDQARR